MKPTGTGKFSDFANVNDARVCLATELGYRRLSREAIMAIDELVCDGRAVVRLAAFDGEDDDRVIVTFYDDHLKAIGNWLVSEEGLRRIELDA